ncbi:MAG: phenylacetate--CoA ligase family protein [Candidatus Methylomirabilales bacterium]
MIDVTPLTVQTAIEGIGWPALPEQRGAAVLATLFQLEQSQWWSAEEILRRQFQQLTLLVAHARRTVPFYRQRLQRVGAEPNEQVTREKWAEIPVLRRTEVQAAGDALFSRLPPRSHGSISGIYTSGSTGKPIRALRTQLWSLFWSAFTIRDHLWHRRDLSGKLAVIRESGKGKAPYPDGTTTPSWGRSSSRVFATGQTVSLNITCTIEQQAEWLERQDPDYLLTHPSIAYRLADYCLGNSVRLSRLRQVETISEILQPATRDACREAWGVPVVDLYSSREAGYIALQCPDHEHYHVQSEGILVEILNEQGRPCVPGEWGRVVVTPLHNFAMPLIRYDIGDHAELGEPCSCGRGLPVLRRILGREQNMLVLPSGEERWPLLSSENIRALLAIAPIRQYQLVQKSVETIELRLATARPVNADEESTLRQWVRDKFGHPFHVPITYHDEIPRGPAGKYDDFISEVKQGATHKID